MMSFESAKGSINPLNIFKVISFRRKFRKEHPLYFDSDGLAIFVGPQGSGKTLSAVKYVENLLKFYPNAILVTNLYLKNYPIVNFNDYVFENYYNFVDENFVFDEEKAYCYYLLENKVFEFVNQDDLKRYSNGERGVIYLIDEIQLYFNSLESKNINPEVMTQISQQRKQRKHIVCTSQVFGRMAKPLREQFNAVIVCQNFLNCIQYNKMVDRDSIEEDSDSMHLHGKVKRKFIWFHRPIDYQSYDTYYVIERNKFVSNENKKEVGLYEYRLYNNNDNNSRTNGN